MELELKVKMVYSRQFFKRQTDTKR